MSVRKMVIDYSDCRICDLPYTNKSKIPKKPLK